ncbi:MAG: DNA polymerase III subunit gamma/tau [Tissierellia bacterium]|nr:DNA polymerase III subunit gamma/tau [Tissierellia bacterium]
MYQAIYRKYRPKVFDNIIGQAEIINVLKNQIINNQIGHAYLFSGTRGTGKTSCAKILSRAVNCLSPKNGNPCNKCDNCQSILSDTNMDVVEMDAASNRRIDDIRDLRDKVIYPPTFLKYKVYIIDEAHMITNEGFNALLKIMEEPPEHLIFILATTELEKIPQTILSRCQRFDFSRIDRDGIAENIKYITTDMGIEIEGEAVDMISRAADGAMRDAQSILDQVIASSGDMITADAVSSIIGAVRSDEIYELVNLIIGRKSGEAILKLEEIFDTGIDSGEFMTSLIDHYRDLLFIKTRSILRNDADVDIQKLENQSKEISLNEVVDSIEIIMDSISNLRKSDLPKIVSQITVVKLIEQVDRKNLLSRIESLEKKIQEMEKSGEITQRVISKRISDISSSHISYGNDKKHIPVDKIEEEAIKDKKDILNIDIKYNIKDKAADEDAKDRDFETDHMSEKESSILDIITESWELYKKAAVAENNYWILWLDKINPVEIKDGVLILMMPEDQGIIFKKAIDHKEELKNSINQYFKTDFEISIEKSISKDKNNDEILEMVTKLFGKENIEKI